MNDEKKGTSESEGPLGLTGSIAASAIFAASYLLLDSENYYYYLLLILNPISDSFYKESWKRTTKRRQQKHKPLASPTLASKATNHKSINTAETEAPPMTYPTKNDDNTNTNKDNKTTTRTITQASKKTNTRKQSSKP